MKTHVKICGVTRVRDARLAVSLGASLIGCVMARDSKRRATPAQAEAIVRAVDEIVPVVLVFRNADGADIADACIRTGALAAQVHGTDETDCLWLESQGVHVIRVRQMTPETRRLPSMKPAPSADRLYLLDSGAGGTGMTWNWKTLGRRAPRHVFIAGGVNPDNVKQLMKLKPFGIDLASGVESSPGVKDEAKLRALFAAIGGAS